MEKTLMLVLSLTVGCASDVSNDAESLAARPYQPLIQPRVTAPVVAVVVTQGVVALSASYRAGQVLYLYNQDGSLYYSFALKEGSGATSTKGLDPFVFHPDYYLVVFRCVGRKGGRYEVVVNEANATTKYVKADDPRFRYESWEQHLLGLFAVETNPMLNPLKARPTKTSQPLAYNRDEVYHPHKVYGNWLQVKWGTERSWQYGWVEWKKNGRLAVELFYFA